MVEKSTHVHLGLERVQIKRMGQHLIYQASENKVY